MMVPSATTAPQSTLSIHLELLTTASSSGFDVLSVIVKLLRGRKAAQLFSINQPVS
jgi:hypothetical protein